MYDNNILREEVFDLYVDLDENKYFANIEEANNYNINTKRFPKKQYSNASNICEIDLNDIVSLKSIPNLRLRNIYLTKENYNDDNLYDIPSDMLKDRFKKFEGNYLNIINNIDSLSNQDKKLFILYSLCILNLAASYDKVVDILSNATKKELKSMIDYLPGDQFDVRFSNDVTLRLETKEKDSLPVFKNVAFKKLNEIPMNQLVDIGNEAIEMFYSLESFMNSTPEDTEFIAMFMQILNELKEKEI